MFLYKDLREKCHDRVDEKWHEGIVRSVHVIMDGTLIGRIREIIERPRWGAGENDKFVVEYRDPRYGFGGNSVGYAPTILQAKKIAEKLLPDAFAEKLERQKSENTTPGRKKLLPIAALPYGDNEDFYPTPQAVAGRMLSLVQWDERIDGCYVPLVESILEPSAGKGDLLDALMNFSSAHKYDYDFNVKLKRRPKWGRSPEQARKMIDCVESDSNLRGILKDKGYRVVDDDFLTFRSHKKYDLILMNPPFSNGDEHLLKALSLIKPYGGQVVCLLNAETIRNPYTNQRKMLLKELSKYGAKFEYIKDGFKKAERRTDVEVVIVAVRIPEPPARSRILEYLKKAPEYTGEDGDPTALAVKGDWVHAMIQAYNFDVDAGVRFLREYQGYAKYAGATNSSKYGPRTVVQLSIGKTKETSSVGTEEINEFLRATRSVYWYKLMHDERLEEIVGKLTSDMRRDYESKVDAMEAYEFSEYNIRELLLDMQSRLNEGLNDAILKLFAELTEKHSWYPECESTIHYYNGWKTNKAHKVGQKVIIPMNGFSSVYGTKSQKLDKYHIASVLDDMERAMDFLDRGQTSWHPDIGMRIEGANNIGTTTIDTAYFQATFYKKGTCHIKFHDSARHIIDRLNIYVGMKKNWLPPYYGKVRYNDMDDEGKAVIDSFHAETCPSGKKSESYQLPSYEEVCNNPDNFLTTAETKLLQLGA